MIALVEGAERQKTPNEIALTILLSALTLVFLLVCVTLKPFGIYSGVVFSTPVLIALLVCLIPTTIGGLLSEWLGRVPVAGESVERNGISAEVVAGNDLRVEQVKLRKARRAQS